MAELETRIAQARGDEPADMVLRGGQVFDLITGEMIAATWRSAATPSSAWARITTGARWWTSQGLTLVPGFIDTHLHVESSLVTPFEFDRCVTPRASPPRSAIPTRSPTSSARRACGISRRRRNTR
jgi:adenine deaminase